MPFIQAGFRFGETAFIQQIPDDLSLVYQLPHIVAVAMPGEKVRSNTGFFTGVQQGIEVIQIETGKSRPADLEFGELGFQAFENGNEELDEQFPVAAPALSAQIRFVPDFPVLHIFIFITVCPAAGVVADDPGEDFGILFKVCGRMGVEMAFIVSPVGRVFNTGAETVKDLHSDAAAEVDNGIG